MTLSELYLFKEKVLELCDSKSSLDSVNQLSANLKILSKNVDTITADVINNEIGTINNITRYIESWDGLNTIIKHINSQIHILSREFFADDYVKELCRKLRNSEHRLNLDLHIPDDVKDDLLSRIRTYVDWHYPTLELGCFKGTWTNFLVGGDPLYIVDLDDCFLSETNSKFNMFYQQRLRKYKIDLVTDGNNLSELPQNQFGFIFSCDFINRLAFKTVEYYLKNLFELLRPGGVLMFTYNNGETYCGADGAMRRIRGYVPQSMLVDVCSKIGYEIIHLYDYDRGYTSWAEIKKPGTLATIKQGQALGRIEDYKPFDFAKK